MPESQPRQKPQSTKTQTERQALALFKQLTKAKQTLVIAATKK